MSEEWSDDRVRFVRTELLERIAHELRGPAGVTLGALDELEHALGGEALEANRTLFAMARRGARRVLRTAERLTRTAQLEGGGAHLTRMPADLRTLVRQATEDAELIEGRSSIHVQLRLPDVPCASEVDSGWLTVALTELVAQAVRSARRSVEVSVQHKASGIRVAVSDDRCANIEAPSARFVPVADRRDAALNWPLVCDVTRAHGAELQQETLRDDGNAVCGFRVSVLFAPSDALISAAAG